MAIIGLGKAGLPLAAVIADSGIKVVGVDINEKVCKKINRGINPIPEEEELNELIKLHGGRTLVATSDYENARECGAYIIIVPLLLNENFSPDFRVLESAVRSVGRILKKRDIVVIETTVPPYTTETLVRKWLEDESGLKLGDYYLAHSPERIMTGYSVSRLREFPKVVGGVNHESGKKAYELYKKFIPNIILVSDAKTAEFIKIIEGCYRDVNIALANELYKISKILKIDFYEARKYANHDYCHIHLPSTGVGGHCIPVYPWFLIKEMEKIEEYEKVRLLRTAREINDEMVHYWANEIILKCLSIDKPLNKIKICINGISFRKGVKELYHSRNLALAKLLKEKGLRVYVHDAMYTPNEVKNIGLSWISPEEADVIFDCYSLKIFVNGNFNKIRKHDVTESKIKEKQNLQKCNISET